MRKVNLQGFVGKRVSLHWRDPQSDSDWTTDPLDKESASVVTLGWFVGFNVLGEAVVASSKARDDDYRDILVIPACLIFRIEEIDVK